jgi:hypothetical protein
MTNAQVKEIMQRHQPEPSPRSNDAIVCAACCQRRGGSAFEVRWPCDAARLADWLAHFRALPTYEDLERKAREAVARQVTPMRPYQQLFPPMEG